MKQIEAMHYNYSYYSYFLKGIILVSPSFFI